MKLTITLLFTGALLATTYVHAEEPAKVPMRVVTNANAATDRAQTRITITGGKAQTAKSLPGSAYVVDKKTLEQGNFSDPQRALRGVPGVNIVEEEGFGNRPNIGLRASRTDRSADVTLMEDGVLIAPAPYSAPSAYFFPRIERMEGIEVRKGSSAIAYGPRTTNGAINFLSSSIPHDLSGMVKGSIGSYGSHREQIRVGNDSKHVGLVIDALNTQSDGFKDTDFVGGNTGFKTQDIMTKFRLKTDVEADIYQELEAKFGYTNEDSDETYLGLTNEDFNANPYRRYAASQLDKVHVGHQLYQLRHYIEPAAGLDITTTAYYRTLDRDWDKLEGVNAGAGNRGLGNVLAAPSSFANELAILRGGNSANNALSYRDNDRTLQVRGVQTAADYKFATGSIEHQLEMGLRLHQDSEDRFQTNHFYRMDNGRMIQTSSAVAGSNSNRISSATAWSGHILNRMDFGALSVTPGVRYEHVELKTREYGASDPDRTGSGLNIYRNEVKEYMPGIGADYQLTPNWIVLAGVHKGFAPPAPPTSNASANTDPEESVNYEAGVRYGLGELDIELVGFYTDYSNLLGIDSTSAGAGTGDQFNGGKVEARGLEASMQANAAQWITASPYKLPIKLSYTFTKTEFGSSFNSSFAEWGNVRKGDEIPYIPRHQIYGSVGVEDELWLINLSGKYTGKQRTVAGRGAFLENASLDASFVVDATAEYEFYKNARAFMQVNNVFDEVYIASRRPSGLRPGAPRMVWGGLKYSF